ncbi:MAG: transposase [Conexivisphaerales archaeon]
MVNNLTAILRSNVGKKYLLYVKERLNEALGIRAKDSDSVIRVLMMASMTNSYVEGMASLLGLCGQTIRNNLKDKDPDALLNLNDDTVKDMKKMGTLKGRLTVAVDWHDIMYYGDSHAEGVVGTKPKEGTHWAYQYGSVVVGKEKLTLAVTPIVKGESRAQHLKRLLARAFELGIRIKLLLLDAGYFSADIINYLQSLGLKFVMRMPNVGIASGAGDDFMYTTRGHRRGDDEQATFRVVALNGRNRIGHMELFIFATNTYLKPQRLRKLFRSRWGIETSYRMINKFLARTTSKLYAIRKLYFYLAVLLYNLWVKLNRSKDRVIVDMLKQSVMLSLILWFIPDMAEGDSHEMDKF